MWLWNAAQRVGQLLKLVTVRLVKSVLEGRVRRSANGNVP